MERLLEQYNAVAARATATQNSYAWTAREPGTDAPLLIKRLPDDTLRSRATQALALQHAGIAPTLKWLYDGPNFYVVRSYIPGTSLRDTLRQGAARAFSSLKAMLDKVLTALETAHESGMVHCGITPENIIVDAAGNPVITDFATVFGPHGDYVPAAMISGRPNPRVDYYALCELYKEFLPESAVQDEAGLAARQRILKNLTEVQQTTTTVNELRYKLDAISRMADILGFDTVEGHEQTAVFHGARLVCSINPPTAMLRPGGVTGVTVGLDNTGDADLQIESIGSDVVWLNPAGKATRITVPPDTGIDVSFTISGARLRAGDYLGHVIVRSNHLMDTPEPPQDTPWHEQQIALPVLVRGMPAKPAESVPLAERLPDKPSEEASVPVNLDPAAAVAPAPRPAPLVEALPAQDSPRPASPASTDAFSRMRFVQSPDPIVVPQGKVGVLHIVAAYSGAARARIDRISTWPPWLIYPGEFKPVALSGEGTTSIGFSVLTPSLSPGDYTAEIIFITSALVESDLGAKTDWRELKCPVHVRVLKAGAVEGPAGCAPIVLAGVLGGLAMELLSRLL